MRNDKEGIAIRDIIDRQKVFKILSGVKIKCDCGYWKLERFWGKKGLIHHRNCGNKQKDWLDQIIKKVKRL